MARSRKYHLRLIAVKIFNASNAYICRLHCSSTVQNRGICIIHHSTLKETAGLNLDSGFSSPRVHRLAREELPRVKAMYTKKERTLCYAANAMTKIDDEPVGSITVKEGHHSRTIPIKSGAKHASTKSRSSKSLLKLCSPFGFKWLQSLTLLMASFHNAPIDRICSPSTSV
jgi:hypothetical protein